MEPVRHNGPDASERSADPGVQHAFLLMLDLYRRRVLYEELSEPEKRLTHQILEMLESSTGSRELGQVVLGHVKVEDLPKVQRERIEAFIQSIETRCAE